MEIDPKDIGTDFSVIDPMDIGTDFDISDAPSVNTSAPAPEKKKGGLFSAYGNFLGDSSAGIVKAAARGVKDLASMVQTGGQRTMAGLSPVKNYEEIRKQTGFDFLKKETPESQAVDESLEAKNKTQKVAGYVETAAEWVTPKKWTQAIISQVAKNASGIPKVAGALEKLSTKRVTKGQIILGGAKDVAKDSFKKAIKKPVKSFKDYMAKHNVTDEPTRYLLNPDKALGNKATDAFESSIAAERQKRAAEKYTSAYNQHINHIKTGKKGAGADEVVGQRVTEAFDKVWYKRQDVGKLKEKELVKIAKNKVDVTKTRNSFYDKMRDEAGVVIKKDKSGKKTLVPSGNYSISRATEGDQQILLDYGDAVQKLGTNPTVKDLDSFAEVWGKTLRERVKSGAYAQGTNAERIVNNNLKEIRETAFTPFKEYNQTRSEYARLSELIGDGEKQLGFETATGNMSKSASAAKRAVQSMSNGGAKDFLTALEKETGYSAIDDMTFAIQAMADAGDVKQASLLKNSMRELFDGNGSIPSKWKILGNILGKIVDANEAPNEKTLRYIQGLKK